ncbi:MAG: toll/interleukin-1 receptor domain-containing protein [Anaerolineae bacterium]|nr:toll/interleukin-1 receptor domain-containing protein [Anaerolineae bacterium]
MNKHSEDYYDGYDETDGEGIEAYCMICREKTPMDNPEAIWTRRGAPGMRGTCSVCGTVVFRMGRTAAHMALSRPDPVQIADTPRVKGQRKAPPPTVTYINYSVPDAEFATRLSDDLTKVGIQTWLAERAVDNVQWATGVHPALVECKRMIIVLTPLGLKATNVTDALTFFVKNRKPIFVIQLQPTDIPDELRRKPRFDFAGANYRRAFRELVQALNE